MEGWRDIAGNVGEAAAANQGVGRVLRLEVKIARQEDGQRLLLFKRLNQAENLGKPLRARSLELMI